MKTCSNPKCLMPIKPVSEFHKNKGRKDGLQDKCKICKAKQDKEYNLKNKEKRSTQAKEYYESNKEQIIQKSKKHRLENLEKRKQYEKEYYLINKEKILRQTKKYDLNNRNKINKYDKKYQKERRQTDINYRILGNLRTRIVTVLKGNTKSDTTKNLVGCSIKFLKQHLEKQFQPGMVWDNHGPGWRGVKEWHIDHIKPCAKFDLSKPEEQRKCFNYKNLQPLWAEDNRKKGSKIEAIINA